MPVTDDQNAQTVPSGMSQSGGVPGGMPTNGSSDATESTAKHEEQLLKLQKDMDRMRSTYDRNQAEREKQWKAERAELEARLHQTAVKDLDEKDRALYERELFAQKAQTLEQQLAQFAEEKQMRENMQTWAGAYKEAFGIDPTTLDMSSPEAFQQSAWQATAAAMAELRQQAGQPASQQSQPTRPAANRGVITNQGGVPQTAMSINDHLANFRRISNNPTASEDDLFTAVERGRYNLG